MLVWTEVIKAGVVFVCGIALGTVLGICLLM